MTGNLPSINDLLSENREGNTPVKKLKKKISDIELKQKEELVEKTAKQKGMPYLNLSGFAISPEALKLIPLATCKKYKMVCFLLLERNARFAATNPLDVNVQKIISDLMSKLHIQTDVYLVSEHSLEFALNVYERLPKITKKVKGVSITEEELERFTADIHKLTDFNKLLENASTTDLVTIIIAAGVKMRASDIHLEPREQEMLVRFRIDGVLHDIASLSEEKRGRINSRIKLLSGLKINVTKRPQDGRFTIYLTKESIDVRVSSLPTDFGETITMRLLMASVANLKMNELGLSTNAHALIQKQIKKPSGMIISTGPTGSGKTTTLYAIMNTLNDSETKIITIEDPIEYRLPNVSQSQVEPKKDYTFAKGLKSLVRQDPDILMVGEIRDADTTEIAIQAALTGHLVLTTLHTNNAPSAPGRLLSLKAQPQLLAQALNTVVGQRLIRKLCKHCKKKTKLTGELRSRARELIEQWPANMQKPSLERATFYTAPGCKECQGFGYWGRIGIFEIVIATKEIKNAVIEGKAAEHQIVEIAQKQGMLTMEQDGLMKAIEGITSIEEVFRVTG